MSFFSFNERFFQAPRPSFNNVQRSLLPTFYNSVLVITIIDDFLHVEKKLMVFSLKFLQRVIRPHRLPCVIKMPFFLSVSIFVSIQLMSTRDM